MGKEVKEAFGLSRSVLVEEGLVPPETEGREFYTPLKSWTDLLKLFRLAKKEGEIRSRDGDESTNTEHDPSFQQIIFYAVIPQGGKIFFYEREEHAEDKYGEARLAGKISLGVGGHGKSEDRDLRDSLYRELAEELLFIVNGEEINLNELGRDERFKAIRSLVRVSPRALLKSEVDNVGRVHFGIVCQLILQVEGMSFKLNPESNENKRSLLLTPEEYLEMKQKNEIDPEPWTDLVFRREFQKSG